MIRPYAALFSHLEQDPAVIKDWPVGAILEEIIYGLDHFTVLAIPQRLDEETRTALQDLAAHTEGVGPASVATGAHYLYTGTGPFPNFGGS